MHPKEFQFFINFKNRQIKHLNFNKKLIFSKMKCQGFTEVESPTLELEISKKREYTQNILLNIIFFSLLLSLSIKKIFEKIITIFFLNY